MAEATLYGFDGSTYVRTTKIVLNRKGVDYEQVQVDVLKGEPRQPEHLKRHPFGKVPVLDIDGHRLRETDAIVNYVEQTREGPSCVPEGAWDIARMSEIMSLIHAYGYDALLGVAFYHIKPDFIGNPDEEAHAKSVEDAKTFLRLVDEIRASDTWLAGASPSLADYMLGPIIFYVAMTPHEHELLEIGGFRDWWERLQADPDFAATKPDLG